MTHLPVVAHAPSLMVRQKREMLEIFTGFETANRYEIIDPNHQVALYALEAQGDGMAVVSRLFLKNKRPFTMHLMDGYGTVHYVLKRPWNWFFSELHVRDGAGQVIGMIDQRFKLFGRRFEIKGPQGEVLAELHGPWFRPWTFHIKMGGQDVGAIRKKWSGLLKEAFTDADNFGVEFGPMMDPRLRTLTLAATFLVDFLYFEQH